MTSLGHRYMHLVGMVRQQRSICIGALIGLALPIAAAALSSPLLVSQHRRAFSIERLLLHIGDAVDFTNDDPYPHELFIDSDTMKYESGVQTPGSTVEVAFPKAGTFEVRCAIHPRMKLLVDVQ